VPEWAGRLLLGCDFSSSPTRRKPIVVAFGGLSGRRVQLLKIERFANLKSFADWLARPLDWVGGFDLPFGLPRELVQTLGWPLQWSECMAHYQSLTRAQIRAEFAAFCAARPVGGKFAHRGTDRLARSSPSMKWVNPPVAYMLHAGVPLLVQAGVELPGLHPGSAANFDAQGRPRRVALEAYPGLLARELLGVRSYKSDQRAGQTTARLIARKDLITALELGRSRLGLQLLLSHAQRDHLVDDARADALDATLCLLQAAWAWQRFEAGDLRFGQPDEMDPLEGWITTA